MKLTLVPFVLAGISISAVSAHAPPASVRPRKSLGFGPVHPHALFESNPVQIPQFTISAKSDPFQVASRYANELIPGHLQDATTFVLRKDSYTDRNTGVTHAYLRQFIHGLEVADGDINVNVKDGVVLSYGDSAYRGVIPHTAQTEAHPHKQYCSELHQEFATRQQSIHQQLAEGQTVLGAGLSHIHEALVRPIEHLLDSVCAHTELPFHLASKPHKLEDARHALLQFMIAATPEQHMVNDILSRYDEYIDAMTSTFESRHVGESMESAIEVIHKVPEAVNPVKARLAYIQVPHGDKLDLELVWKFEVEMKDNWYEASVSANAPHKIISVVDWASDAYAPIPAPAEREPATYNVFAWGINDPSEGERSMQKENYDSLASPMGWHSVPIANDPQSQGRRYNHGSSWRNTTTTYGNNAFAHEDWEGRNNYLNNYRPDGGEGLVFDFPYNPKETDKEDAQDEAKKYINATVTQLFYTTNMVHDLYYRYGFDEVAGNFQQHNFGRGGEENDGVIANAQDGSGYNNANFMTPPDGQNGRCRMYLWNTATPYRDGDLEAGIVIHELTHGLSTRLTGGPANSGCLGWGESGGMGEGWGDFLATTIRSTSTYSDYSMGSWAANRENGIRNFVYSLDKTVNPSTYKTLDKPGYWGVHAIGEVWAEMLWVVSQKLINKHGFSETLFPPKADEKTGEVPEGDFYRKAEYSAAGDRLPLIPKHGNSLIVQLVLNGMKLQPCRPSFFEARDAIIQADQILTGGENLCHLWEGFSERGLGPLARVDGRTPWGGGIRTDDFTLPKACQNGNPIPNPEPTPEEPPSVPEDPWTLL